MKILNVGRDYRHYSTRFFQKGKYFAFYVDLLGQKDFYADFENNLTSHGTLIGVRLKQIVYVMDKVYSYVNAAMSKIASDTQYLYERLIAFGSVKYSKMDRREFDNKIKALEFGTQQFSDALIFYLKDKEDVSSDVFPICVTLLSRLAMEYLPNRVAFRGAITYSEGWEAGFNTIDGEILKELDELESKISIYPRIVVSKRFCEYCEAAKKTNSGNIHNIENYCVGLLPIIKRDVDGNSYLDLWNDTYRRGLNEAELGSHEDLLVSSCKFLYDEYHVRCQEAHDASSVDEASKQAAIANKYLLAYEKLSSKICHWTHKSFDFSKVLPEYLPSLTNYKDTQVQVESFTVVRLAFLASNHQDIDQSRIVDRGVRAIEKVMFWLKNDTCAAERLSHHIKVLHKKISVKEFGGIIFQDIVIQRIANVVVIAFKQQIATSEYLMLLYLLLAKLITRLMGRGVFVSGSTVYGRGWLMQNTVLCGPVMQRSVEYQVKLGSLHRVVFDALVANGFRESIKSIKTRNPNINVTHPNLEDCIIQDADGVEILDYLGVYECVSKLTEKTTARYNADLIKLKKSFGAIFDVTKDSRKRFQLYAASRYIDKYDCV